MSRRQRTEERGEPHTPEETDEDGSPAEAREAAEDDRPVVAKLVAGLHDEAGRAIRSLLDRNPVGTDTVERVFEIAIRLLNRREVLERILHSEFMKNVRVMQSEITEAVGLASQSDVHELRNQLAEALARLEKLQNTLDEIAVEVDGPEQ